jgi:hypothetical protein
MAAAHETAGTSFQTTGIRAAVGAAFINKMASSAAAAGKESDDAGKGLSGFARSGDDASRSASGLGRSLGGLGDSVDGVGGGVSGLARGLNSLGEASSLGNVMGKASSAVSMFGTAAAYSAVGSGALTGAVAALGAVGVGALGGVGVAAGLAGGAMASFTADAQKDSAKFGDTFKQMGGQAHLAGQMISEPFADAMVSMGRSLVNANNQMTPAGMAIATSLKAGFGEAADVITQNSGAIVGAAAEAAGGFAKLTGEAAPGVSAFLGQLPSLTNGAVSGMSQVASEFGNSSRQIEGATPALNRMMGAVGGLGAELVHIGGGSMVPLAEDMTSMTRSATRMASQLEPAIKPSMSAFTDLADAGMGALGGLTPQIGAFAGTLSQNAAPLGSILGSLGRGMLSMGSAAVDGLGMAAPAISGMADAIQQNQGPMTSMIGSLVGGAADAVTTGSKVAGGIASFDSLSGGLSDLTGGPIAPPGSLNGAAIEHNINSYLNPVGAFKEAFGIGQPGSGAAAPTAPAIAAQRATGMANMSAASAGYGAAPAMSVTSAPVPAAQVGGGAARAATAIGAAPAYNSAPVAAAAMTAGAGSVSAAPMTSALTGAVQRATKVATSTATEGGGSVGSALGAGVGAGVTSTQTINDTIFRKHVVKIVDAGKVGGDIHSPSRKTRREVGQPLGQGTALGVQDTFAQNRDAMGGLLGHYANENKAAPVITIRGGGGRGRIAQNTSDPDAAAPLSGKAKQAAFGEDPNGSGTRAVFDKGVQSWNANPGVDVTQIHDMAELNKSISSPLSGQQYSAMVNMQGVLDQPGLTRNSQMFGQRTEQNIMRNRPGAFDVAGQWANHLEDQKDQAREVGKSSADGVAEGMNSRYPVVFGAGRKTAQAGQQGYKKEDQQNSPSAVWAGMGGNSVAGVPIGFAAGVPAAVSAMSSSASAMSGALQGPLADYGLQAGYTYVQAFADGSSRQIKKADYQALGEPSNLSPAAMSKLAATGLLRAGSGAFTTKTPSGAPGAVMLAPAATSSAPPQTITIQVQHMEGDRMSDIADQRIELAFDAATNTYQTL